MDTNLFSRMVKELLADTGSAVVPGFGKFSVEDVPASFSDRGFTLNPPYRRVSFTLSDETDDTLASLYAASNDLDIRKSQSVVLDYVVKLKDELRSSRTVVLPEFGQLRQAGRNCVVFVPDEGLSIFPQFDLLLPLSLKSRNFTAAADEHPADAGVGTLQEPKMDSETGQETTSGVLADSELLEGETVPEKSGGLSGFWKAVIVIAAVCLILLLALAVLGRLAPDLVDSLLYNDAQLEILRKAL